ncbi:hypothetical protein RHMOL_Rhmol07G0202800 [Rhododendron molle]|uniref:Uncharacterized protein n=1 Tax=Rhododendron molle TaxID=49168 RepID=A0ACC0N2P3_RHOML|nr:hypothetical protein RHMOL_Rhmol07G0202800 [Rhododendron molle]
MTNALETKVEQLTRKLEQMELKGSHEVKSVVKVEEVCAICEMAGHSTGECFNIPALKNVLNGMSPEEMSAIQRY